MGKQRSRTVVFVGKGRNGTAEVPSSRLVYSSTPDRDAVRHFDAALSYRELDDLADRFAAVLAKRRGEGR